MAQRYPIGYIRRSSADAASPGDVSREGQEAAVRELARRDGHNGETRILVDWDKSADPDKESRRTGYLAMLAAIERGEVSAVYAASLDRLYRSMRTFVRLTDAAKAHGVRIVTLREGVLGGDGSPMAQAFAEITAVFSGLELRTAKARAAGGLAVRRERGDHIGMVGYGWRLARTPDGKLARTATGGNILEPDPDRPLAPIIASVREAGTILGGCKLLQARGIPAPDGGTVWGSTTLRRIIERNAPELLPAAGPSGRRQPTNAVLAQLLVCHCGQPALEAGLPVATLTPQGARRWANPAYRCRRGNRLGRAIHGLYSVPEPDVLPWIRAEVERLRLPVDAVRLATDNAERRAALAARLERAHELYIEGGIDRARHDREAAAVAAELDTMAATEDVAAVPPIRPDEWETWVPADLNAYLRSILERVELGPDMRPVRAIWRNPALRSSSGDA